MTSSANPSPRVALPYEERKLPSGARVVGPTPAATPIRVSIIVKRRNPLNLEQTREQFLRTPLSQEEFSERYGADPAAFDQIRQFVQEHGLAVDENASSLARRTFVVYGTAEQMREAFQVGLQEIEAGETLPEVQNESSTRTQSGTVQYRATQYRAMTSAITLPESCASIIDAVLGLDTRPQARTHFRLLKDMDQNANLRPAAAGAEAYLPRQVAGFYSFPTDADGTGQTIGILELGGGYTTTDIQQYFQNQNIAPPDVVAISVDGAANSPTNPSSADSEVMLDIEIAASIAPAAKIAVYFAPNTDQGFLDGLTTAIHDTTNHPNVISISWGGPESSWTKTAMTALDDACQSAAALGITITVACGDSGSTDGVDDGANHVDFPASSPHVLACGGTEIAATGGKLTSEVVWNDEAQGGGATGGGVSTVFALPSWQANAKVPKPSGSSGGRGTPDVAGDAAPETGYQIQVDGQTEVVGGTSAVAPLWAGLIALMNQKLGKPVGFLNPQVYPLLGSAAFRDITTGTNGAYSAGPGWDPCTGLGSPVGTQLLAKL
jgi:kumamolisin